MSANQITHILSYDLVGKSEDFYRELDNLIREEFPWSKKPLRSFWEISTTRTSEDLRNFIVTQSWIDSKVNVYQVRVLEKKTHPVIPPKKLSIK